MRRSLLGLGSSAALAFAVIILVGVLGTITYRGYTGFAQTQVLLPVTFDADTIGLYDGDEVATLPISGFGFAARQAPSQFFPEAAGEEVAACVYAIQFQDLFVGDAEISHVKAGKAAHHFVVIAADIIDAGAFGQESHDVADDHRMRVGPEAPVKLPYIDNVPVKHENFRLDAAQVAHQFFCPAPMGTEMNI